MRQAIDDNVVFAGLLQVERLDIDTLDFEFEGVLAHWNREIQFPDQGFIANRPAYIGTERQPDSSCLFRHGLVFLIG